MEYLHATLAKIFHQEGYVLHGGTPVKKRSEIVAAFQQEAYVPYIVLSLKAAGTGLNLTAAVSNRFFLLRKLCQHNGDKHEYTPQDLPAA